MALYSNKNENDKLKTNDSYKSYKDFKESLNKSVIINTNVKEHRDSISTAKGNLVVCVSKDLNFSENFLKEFNSKFNDKEYLESLNLNLYEITSVQKENFKIYYLIGKNFYYDNFDTADLFKCFSNLNEILIKDSVKSVDLPHNFNDSNKSKFEIIRAMLRYIFQGSDIIINIYLDSKYTPKPSEIKRIIEENHCSTISGHIGFHKTYKKIRESSKWDNMKKDIYNFVKTCE